MLFAITCEDRPGALELRMATRPTHLDWLRGHVSRLVMVGPTLDDDGKPRGSLLVVDVPDRAAAEAFAAADPYAVAGLFARTEIHPFRAVFRDGAELG